MPPVSGVNRKGFLFGFVVLCTAGLAGLGICQASNHSVSRRTVILVHGIINKPFVMSRIGGALERKGYDVKNWRYPSTSGLIEEHASHLHQFILGLDTKAPIDLVGFSQGAIIIRYMLVHYPAKGIGRFVMIAPPNHGSEMAEDFYKYAWFRGLYGDKSIKQLFAKQNAFLESCGIPKTPFGIIAGGKGDGVGFSDSIPGDDDGTVSVASTRLEGARDFIVLPHRHTPMVFALEAIENTAAFLQTGRFLHGDEKH